LFILFDVNLFFAKNHKVLNLTSIKQISLGEKMKALTILTAIAFASSSAMALDTTMNALGRFDYIRTTTKNTATGVTDTKSATGEYKPTFLNWNTEAKFNETTKLKLSLDFTDSAGAVQNSVSEFVDEAFLTKTMGDFSVMAGKHAPALGGFEQMTSKRDVYVLSKYNATVPDNSTGLTAAYTFMNNTLMLQHFENNTNSGTNPTFTDKKISGVSYMGKFMDGMISPMLSYHKIGTARSGNNDIHTGAGLQVSAMNVVFQFDYLMLKQEKAGTDALAAVVDGELKSMVAHVRYNHENFKPFLKYISEKAEGSITNLVAGAVETKRSAWELGLEYVPNKDEDMNYHVVYNSATVKHSTGTTGTKNTESKLYAGVSFGLNILK
jgi:hypothetical protein